MKSGKFLAQCLRRLLGLLLCATLASAAAQEIEGLHTGDMARLRQSYAGRPLLLHYWSLTCAPCLNELPVWAARMRRHPEVAFVFISTDTPQQAPALAARLRAAGVHPTRALVYADDFSERLQYEIDAAWHGELPRSEFTSASAAHLVQAGTLSEAMFRRWVNAARR